MKSYCLGFVFNRNLDKVYLIAKQAPAWQAGFWNCLGGKVEVGESPLEAMRREAVEEAGYSSDSWRYLGRMAGRNDGAGGEAEGEEFECAVYFDRCKFHTMLPATTTAEEIVCAEVRTMPSWQEKALKNVPFLVLACLARFAGQEFELDLKYGLCP